MFLCLFQTDILLCDKKTLHIFLLPMIQQTYIFLLPIIQQPYIFLLTIIQQTYIFLLPMIQQPYIFLLPIFTLYLSFAHHPTSTNKSPIFSGDKASNFSPNLKHKFIKTHHSLPTKREQYTKMREFEETVIQRRSAEERQVLTGTKEVAKIEKRLRKVNK